MGIDIDKIPKGLIDKTVSELGLNEISIRSVVNLLKEVAGNGEDNNFCTLEIRKIKNDLEERKELPKSVVADIIGPLNLKIDNLSFVCSFLAGREPKIYCLPYFLLAKGTGAKLTVWIDDVFAMLKYQRTLDEQLKFNLVYKRTFKRFNLLTIFSSEYFSNFVIPDTIINNVIKIGWPEFFNLLPYGKRQLAYIKVSDLLHCLWFATILSRCNQDYFLTSINNLGGSGLLMRALSTKRNFIFIPKAPIECGDPRVYTLNKLDNQFNNLGRDMIEYLFNFYKFAYNTNKDFEYSQKVKLIKKYIERGND